MPGASALAEARERLGEEPLKLLFATAARPLATRKTRGAWYRSWRVMVLDGTCLDVPDSPANQVLGRAKSGRGEGVGAFPQVRVVGLVEAGTHAIIDAVQGPSARGEQTLARGLARQGGPLGAGVLLLADRLFVGGELWRAMARRTRRSRPRAPSASAFSRAEPASSPSNIPEGRLRLHQRTAGAPPPRPGWPRSPRARRACSGVSSRRNPREHNHRPHKSRLTSY